MPEIVQLVPFCVKSQTLHRMVARDIAGMWARDRYMYVILLTCREGG